MKQVNPLRVVLAAAGKDLQVIFRDTGLLAVIIALPMAFSILNGSVTQSATRASEGESILPVALVNEDSGIYGQQLENTLSEISALNIFSYDTISAAREQVLDSRVLAAVLIPPDFTASVQEYRPSEIQVMVDPTQQSIAASITGILKEVIMPVVIQGEVSYAIGTLLSEEPLYQNASPDVRQALEAQSMAVEMAQVSRMISDPWVRVEARTQTGEDVVVIPHNVFALIVPSFSVMFAFFIVGHMGAELLREKREGTLRRQLAAPIPGWAVIAGKMLAFIGLVLVQMVLLFAVASLAFGMPLGSSPGGLLLIVITLGLAATGLGMMLAALARSEKQADGLGTLLGFALAGLGGCFTFGGAPLYHSGGAIEVVSRLTPHAHALIAYDKLLNQGAGLVDVLPQAGILIGFALLFFLIASWRFRLV